MDVDNLAEVLCANGHAATRKRSLFRLDKHLACAFHIGLAIHLARHLEEPTNA